MRLLVQHHSRYRFPRPATLGPHLLRLRPAQHARAKIESYGLSIEQPSNLRWQQDPAGNHVARITFDDGVRVDRLDVLVELGVDIRPVNPFDFFLDDRAERVPFAYPQEIARDLAPSSTRQTLRTPAAPASIASSPSCRRRAPRSTSWSRSTPRSTSASAT